MKKSTVLLFIAFSFICLAISCRKNFIESSSPLSETASVTLDAVTDTKLQVTVVSSPAGGANAVTNLIDGSLATIWSGQNSPNVYLPNPNSQFVTFRLDTTAMQVVSSVKIAFYYGGNTTTRYNFDVLVSQDGLTGWVTVMANKNSYANNNGLQTFDFADTKGKFVRIVGHGNNGSSPAANIWSEVEIYGYAAPQKNTAKISILPSRVSANNVVSPYVPSNIVDGNLTTYWTSKMNTETDYKNITVNLGKIYLLDQVKLSMYTGNDPARVSRFGVFVSTDSITWTKVISNTYSASKQFNNILESFDFPDINAKYVRVECYGHTGAYSSTLFNSINELEVWGNPIDINTCKILSVEQCPKENPSSFTRKGYFYYNSKGLLEKIDFNNIGFGFYEKVLWLFSYDASGRLASMETREQETSAGVAKTVTNFIWANGRIVKEVTRSYQLGATFNIYDSLVYDTQGRIVAEYQRSVFENGLPDHLETLTYGYNSKGNRYEVADNKVSFLRTDSLLMYLTRNYSVNNPGYANNGYNSNGYILGYYPAFQGNIPFEFFSSGIIKNIEYSCP
jgi:hypothetical protein